MLSESQIFLILLAKSTLIGQNLRSGSYGDRLLPIVFCDRINLAAWQKELAANRDQYGRFFASQCEELHRTNGESRRVRASLC